MLCFSGFFFFKQKTAYEMRISDWSSDVCSSDLPQRLVRLQLIAPVLLRTQLGIAGIAVVVVQKGARQEVVEVELFDLSLDFQRQVEARRRRPGERQRPLGANEAALQTVHAALRKRRMFVARDEIGRDSCREGVRKYGRISVVAVYL